MSKTDYDLCVIGAGSGGLVAAAGAAALGARVVLIERHKMGGDCLNYGCVPSKALLHAAKVAHTQRSAARFGVAPHEPRADLARAMQYVASVIQVIAPHDSPERFRALGVEVLLGAGRFADERTVRVNNRVITARKFVLATGSRAAVPPLEGLDAVPYLTNETLFSLREPVPALIVLGGGPIGLEMAQAFARLGTRVSVVQRGGQILPKEDADVAEVALHCLRGEGVQFYLDTSAQRVAGGAGDIRVTLRTPDGAQAVHGTHLLIAAGRQPTLDNLGLDAAGVRRDAQGRLLLDRRLRTTNKNIYACGDVTGGYQFTHMAEHQAGVVLRNALFHWPAKVEQRVIPWCTFTDPEVARVGLSEGEARARGIAHRAYRFPFHDLDRAQTDGASVGFAKVITTPRGTLLGATLVGAQAGELIHEYVLALAKRMKITDLTKIIHIYPTLAQINRRVADVRLKQGLTPSAKHWIKRLFRLRG